MTFPFTTRILDKNALEQLNQLDPNGDGSFVTELIDLFLQAVPNNLVTMKTGLKDTDYGKIKKEAHSLKSSSKQLGANEFSRICLELEELQSHAQSHVQFQNLIQMLDHEFKEIKTEIETVFKKHSQN